MIIKLTKKNGVVVTLDEPAPVEIIHVPGQNTYVRGVTPLLRATAWQLNSANIASIELIAE